jgi:hypothetical protein
LGLERARAIWRDVPGMEDGGWLTERHGCGVRS